MTLQEAKTGKRPNVDDLHTFGCDAWVKIEKGQLFQGKRREKWDPVAQKAIFLGCCDVSPSYYCLILDTNKVVRSRNVRFAQKSFAHVKLLLSPMRGGIRGVASRTALEASGGDQNEFEAVLVT